LELMVDLILWERPRRSVTERGGIVRILEHLGVSTGGAADEASARRAVIGSEGGGGGRTPPALCWAVRAVVCPTTARAGGMPTRCATRVGWRWRNPRRLV